MAAVAFPILLPLVLMVLLIVIRSALFSRWTGVAGSMAMLIVAIYLTILVNEHGILTLQAGGWEAPFGITAVALITGLLTLYSMIKIWNEAFLKKPPENQENDSTKVRLRFMDVLPSLILGLVTILMGIFAAPVFRYTMDAASGLLDPSVYIETVLNGMQQ